MIVKYLIVAFSVVLILSCSTSKKAIDENQPEWSKSRPQTDYYYIGISKVSKKIHPTDYRETAKQMALNDLSSEISITIKSNSIISSFEDNDNFRSDYQQYINAETNKDLSGFEMVADYDTKYSYQVYYRLSKKKWAEIQLQRKHNAAKKAFHWYQQANNETKILNYRSAIQYYINGLVEIKKYWSESVNYTDENNNIEIDQSIKKELLILLSNINIKLNRTKISLDSKNHYAENVEISIVNNKGELLKNIPFKIQYSKSNLPFEAKYNSLPSPTVININNPNFQKSTNTFSVNIVKDKLLNIRSQDRRMLKFIEDAFNIKPQSIPIEIILPKVYLSSSSNSELKNKSTQMHFLTESIETALSKKKIIIANNLKESDLNIIVKTHETKGPDKQKFKSIYLSYTLEVRNTDSNRIIYTESYPKVKGTDITYEKAKQKAYSKAAEEFKYQYSKKLIKGILN